MTLAGCKDRNVRYIVNYPKADMIIKTLLKETRILNGYNPSLRVSPVDFGPFIDFINHPSDEDMYMTLYNRFTAMDIIHQSDLFRIEPSYNTIRMGIVDLYDPEEVQRINNRYFRKYPLDLNVL